MALNKIEKMSFEAKCEQAVQGWEWVSKNFAQACVDSFPDKFAMDRVARSPRLKGYYVEHTWAQIFRQAVRYFS